VESVTIISCNRLHLAERCAQRGYTIDEVLPCVISKNGDIWTIDTNHPAYPKTARPNAPKAKILTKTAAESSCKAGTALKEIIKKWLKITATATCSCNARAQTMDANGCDWCEQNIDTIVGWLREEAKKRRLPFVDIAGRVIVKKAIANARKVKIK